MYPVAEPQIAIVTHSGVDTDSKDHKANNRDDLDQRKPELDLTKEVDRQEVYKSDDNPEDRNEDGNVDIFIPILNDQASCRQFHRIGTGPGKPIDPAHGKPKTGVDQPRRIGCEGSSNGEIRRKFSHRNHDRVNNRSHEEIRDQGTDRTGFGNGSTATDEKTCTNGTT